MNRQHRFAFLPLLVAGALLAALLAACGAPAAPQTAVGTTGEDTQKVTLRLNWTVYGEHAPFFLALEKGFYKEAGLDVEILEGSGSATTVKLIGNGTNDFGYADAGSMMKAVAVGVPVKAVATLVQVNPMAAIFLAENPIKSPQDFVGKKIAITSGDSLSQIFPAVLASNNIDPAQVELVSLPTPAAKETALLQKQIDAFLGYYIDQPPRLEYNQKVDLDWFKFSDAGVNTLSGAILVNTRTLDDRPEVVKRFVAATQKGVRAALDNPQEAAAILSRHAKGFDVPLSKTEIDLTLPLRYTEKSKDKPIGWMAPEDWQSTLDVLTRYAQLKGEQDINVYFTNEFLSDIK